MIIDVSKIKALGKTEEDFSFIYTPEHNMLSLPAATIEWVRVDGTVRLVGKNAEVEGNVVFLVKGECSRCLKEASVEIEERLEAEFSPLAGAEFPIRSGIIDLTAPVEELVVIGSPQVIYCKEDCKGLCPICGANLNDGVCNCKNNERGV